MSIPSSFAFSLDRNAATPVFEQICAKIRTRIVAGTLEAGAKLPATRVLAVDLGVSRSTIVTAYEQLTAEGYIQGLRGSGYAVCQIGSVEMAAPRPQVPTRPPPKPPQETGQIFRAGQPDMRLFPYRQWAKTIARTCRMAPESMMTTAGTMGNYALRTAIARHVAEWRGITAQPEQILITAGSGDALEICIRALTKSGDQIGLEDPGYLPLHNFVTGFGLRPQYLAIGSQGAALPDGDFGDCPRLVVLTPSHQYPLGGAMGPQRRHEFISWAKDAQSWIIEDDYDSEFRYAGRPIPAMASMDQLHRTIYVGSFSKIFSNSLRLGYIVLPDLLVSRFETIIGATGSKASFMPQQPLADFINTGEFYRHLRRMRRIYGERRRFLVTELGTRLGEFGSFQDHQAGMQIAFHLRRDLNDVDVAQTAKMAGIITAPLSRYGQERSGQRNGLLLGFCGFDLDELETGLSILANILTEMHNNAEKSGPHP